MMTEFNFYSWLLSPIPIVCLFIGIMKLFSGYLRFAILHIGKICHLLFVIHPITRAIVLYIQNIYSINLYSSVLLYLLLSYGASLLVSNLLKLRYSF